MSVGVMPSCYESDSGSGPRTIICVKSVRFGKNTSQIVFQRSASHEGTAGGMFHYVLWKISFWRAKSMVRHPTPRHYVWFIESGAQCRVLLRINEAASAFHKKSTEFNKFRQANGLQHWRFGSLSCRREHRIPSGCSMVILMWVLILLMTESASCQKEKAVAPKRSMTHSLSKKLLGSSFPGFRK